MKAKKIISLILVFAIISSIFVYRSQKANADALTLAGLSAAAYAMSQSFGMSFLPTDGTVQGVQNFMNGRILDKLGGMSPSQYFGEEILRSVAGKLIVPVTIYNFLKDIISDVKSANNVQEGGSAQIISTGSTLGCVLTPLGQQSSGTIGDDYYNRLQVNQINGGGLFTITKSGENVYNYYLEGSLINTYTLTAENNIVSGFILQKTGSTSYQANIITENNYNNTWGLAGSKNFSYSGSVDSEISAQIPNTYSSPEVDVGYQWEGSLPGTAPDTNLEQLIGQIYDLLIDLNLSVDGDVTEVGPEPTPAPTTPPVDDIIDGINDIIGQLDTVNEGIGEITGSMADTIEGTAEAVGSIDETLSNALAMPDSSELPDFKFDLRQLFPFCIPFDIYNLLSRFDASPTAPHVQIPFIIPSIGFRYNIDLDFSAFDSVATVLRTVEFIVYAIGLALVTGKVIKW